MKVSDSGEIASTALFSAFVSSRLRCSTAASRRIGPAYPARRASGKGNWDWPKPTTCSGLPLSRYPAYSAFWSAFGATCLRMQRLASSLGLGTTARLGARKNLRAFRVTCCKHGGSGSSARFCPYYRVERRQCASKGLETKTLWGSFRRISIGNPPVAAALSNE